MQTVTETVVLFKPWNYRRIETESKSRCIAFQTFLTNTLIMNDYKFDFESKEPFSLSCGHVHAVIFSTVTIYMYMCKTPASDKQFRYMCKTPASDKQFVYMCITSASDKQFH